MRAKKEQRLLKSIDKHCKTRQHKMVSSGDEQGGWSNRYHAADCSTSASEQCTNYYKSQIIEKITT
jgi:hypothetical protein